MARETFRVEGLRDLEKALKELPKATGKNALKRALMKAGRPIERAAEQGASRGSGQLKESINISTRLSKRQRSMHRKKDPVEVFIGAGPLPQAHMTEFGSAHNAAKAFMRPAWDGNRMKALDSIKSDLASEIEKARQRLARKTARLARRT